MPTLRLSLSLCVIHAITVVSADRAPTWQEVEDHAHQQRNIIQACVNTLKSRELTDIANWTRAAEILGQYRVLEMAPLLISHINTFDGDEIGLTIAQRALISMGLSIVVPALKQLGSLKPPEQIMLMRVIEEVAPQRSLVEALFSNLSEEQALEAKRILAPFLSKWGKNFKRDQ